MAKKKVEHIAVGKTERTVGVVLTDDERRERGLAMATAQEQLNGFEEKKAEMSAHYNAEIKTEKAVLRKLATVVRSGVEYREIECNIYLRNDGSGIVDIIRPDTGEVVGTREATPVELQSELPI